MEALLAPIDSVLQVVAGPGTGKTKLITCRVAYMLLHHKIPPSRLIVTTFTKKAALEMKERLEELLSGFDVDLNQLNIGTFHSLCYRLLLFFGNKIGIQNRKIADDSDQNELLTSAIEDLEIPTPEGKTKATLKKRLKNYIARQKSTGYHPDDIRPDPENEIDQENYNVYVRYQSYLDKNNKLDFDDILVYTNKLLKKFPECVRFNQHVLIDEFQDTNAIQLDILYQLCEPCNDNVTVVGDADQSIYGFRNAEYTNFERMEKTFQERKRNILKIVLSQNYRSTAHILDVAECLMRHQSGRENKELKSKSSSTVPVMLTSFEENEDGSEAKNIADLVKQYTQNGLEGKKYVYSDFAVISRLTRHFRSIEMALLHAEIPYIIVKGTSFWEMKEIKMATTIFNCVLSRNDWMSYKYLLKDFVDGLGPKVLKSIEDIVFGKLETSKFVDVVSLLEDIVIGKLKVRAGKKGLENLKILIETIDSLRILLDDPLPDRDTDIYMEQKFNEIMNRMELVSQITKFKCKNSKKEPEEIEKSVLNNIDEYRIQFKSFNPTDNEILLKAQKELYGDSEYEMKNPEYFKDILSSFLDTVYLYESLQKNEEGDNTPRVTICTIHSSKGLEWPVVFVPHVLNGVLPCSFSADAKIAPEIYEKLRQDHDNEERRCFYVALTRAKDAVHISYTPMVTAWSSQTCSTFIKEIETKVFDSKPVSPTKGEIKYKKAMAQKAFKRNGTWSGFTTVSSMIKNEKSTFLRHNTSVSSYEKREKETTTGFLQNPIQKTTATSFESVKNLVAKTKSEESTYSTFKKRKTQSIRPFYPAQEQRTAVVKPYLKSAQGGDKNKNITDSIVAAMENDSFSDDSLDPENFFS